MGRAGVNLACEVDRVGKVGARVQDWCLAWPGFEFAIEQVMRPKGLPERPTELGARAVPIFHRIDGGNPMVTGDAGLAVTEQGAARGEYRSGDDRPWPLYLIPGIIDEGRRPHARSILGQLEVVGRKFEQAGKVDP